MPKFSPAELTDMMVTAEDTFNDTCTIRHSTGTTQNSYADVEDTFVDYEDVACGFSYKPEMQTERGQIVTLDADAVLRLDLEQPIGARDEVIIRDKRFEVDGVIDGRTVRVVALKSVETSE